MKRTVIFLLSILCCMGIAKGQVNVFNLPGENAGEKITSCINSLSSAGGVCSMQDFDGKGEQKISTDIFTAVTKKVTIIWGSGTYNFTSSNFVPSNISFVARHGTILAPAAATTLTINGPFAGTESANLGGTGTILFGTTGTLLFSGMNFVRTSGQIVLGTSPKQTTLNAPNPSGSVTLTLPSTTDTLVGRGTTDTLTNKTLTTPIISSISNTGTITLPTITDTLVGRTTTDTLTNKTLTSPTMTSPTVNTSFLQGSAFKHQRFGPTTATAALAGATATTVYTWTSAFADANYSVSCNPDGAATGVPAWSGVVSKGAGTVTVQVTAVTAAAASWAGVDCIAAHD